MTTELVKILEKALAFKESSNHWFEIYEESNDQTDWQVCVGYNERAHGLLDAYKILTGKKVNCSIYSIREELETL